MDMDLNAEETHIMNGINTGFVPEPKGLGYAFFQYMSRNRHLVAQIDGDSGVKDSYGNLLERCVNTALEMRRKGVQPNDIIIICSLNHLNSCVPYIAAMFIGAIPTCLDPMLSLSDTVHLLKQIKSSFVFVDQKSINLIVSALSQTNNNAEIIVFGESEKYIEFRDFVGSNTDKHFTPYEVSDNKDTAVIFFSSGTTGLPKGIRISHRAILGQGNVIVSQGICFQIALSYASFYWISSTFTLTATMLTGGCRLVVPTMNPRVHWKLLDKFKVTCALLAPSQAMAILKHGRPKGPDTSCLTDILIGGGSLPDYHIQDICKLFPESNCNLVYGQTECAGLVLNFNRLIPKEVTLMQTKPGSSGLISPDYSIKVVDLNTGKILGPNKKGEILIKSDYVMNGYYNLDSNDVWSPDSWLRSGDIGYYDEDFCFFIVDRIKEMLKFQSYHIPPAIIENVLMSHPKIRCAAVIGIPDDVDGDHPLGVICLRDDLDNVSEEEIIKYVDERVHDRYRLRGGVKFVNNLPRTVTGKIRKNYLKELILGNKIF